MHTYYLIDAQIDWITFSVANFMLFFQPVSLADAPVFCQVTCEGQELLLEGSCGISDSAQWGLKLIGRSCAVLAHVEGFNYQATAEGYVAILYDFRSQFGSPRHPIPLILSQTIRHPLAILIDIRKCASRQSHRSSNILRRVALRLKNIVLECCGCGLIIQKSLSAIICLALRLPPLRLPHPISLPHNPFAAITLPNSFLLINSVSVKLPGSLILRMDLFVSLIIIVTSLPCRTITDKADIFLSGKREAVGAIFGCFCENLGFFLP